jgi:EmrB/QacA subfamily drug resistance transporter
MATLDSSIVNIGLPTLTKEFSTDLTAVKWVVVVYLLAISCLILPAGRVSDQMGRKKTFVLGFAIFAVGSLLCGLASSIPSLIAFRMFQGIGAALLMANGPAVITAAFPARERGGALGTMSMVVSAGLVSGPSLGGFLISQVGWRSIFLVNIPVAILGLYLAGKNIEDTSTRRSSFKFDWAGAILQAVILLLFLASLDPPHVQWVKMLEAFPYWRWMVSLIAMLLFLVFIRVESRAELPVMDLSLLRIRGFWMPNLAGFLTFIAYSAVSVLMPFYLEEEMLFTPSQAGFLMTAVPLTIFVVAPVSGRISDRIGNYGLSVAGGVIGALGLMAIGGFFGSGISGESSSLQVVAALCSVGLATGLFQSPNNTAIMNAVPPEKLGVASALLATFRNLGLVLGTGMSTALFSWRLGAHGNLTSALHFTLMMASAVAFMAAFVSFARRSHR